MVKKKILNLYAGIGGNRKDQIIRNCVDPNLGVYVLNCATKV